MKINNIITRDNPFYVKSPDFIIMDNVISEAYQDWLIDCIKNDCLLYTSPSPRDLSTSRMPSSA